MDKSTVLLAEQVGIFLLPTIKSMVDSMLLKSQEKSYEKFLQLADEAARMRAAVTAHDDHVAKHVNDTRAQLESMKEANIGVRDELLAVMQNYGTDQTAEFQKHADAVEANAKLLDKLNVSIVEISDKTFEETLTLKNGAAELVTDLQSLWQTTRSLSDGLETSRTVAQEANDTTRAALAEFINTNAVSLLGISTDISASQKDVEEVRQQTLELSGRVSTSVDALEGMVKSAQDDLGTRVAELAVHTSKVHIELRESLSSLNVHHEALRDSVASTNEALVAHQDGLEKAFKEVDKESSTARSLASSVAERLAAALVDAEAEKARLDSTREEMLSTIGKGLDSLPALVNQALLDNAPQVVAQELDEAVPALQKALTLAVEDHVNKAVAKLPPPKAGKDGENGENGSDGLAGLLPVAESFIDGVVYERACVVLHVGGTWQAVRRTKTAPAPDVADWQALAVGVSALSVDVERNARTIELKVVMTDGSQILSKTGVDTMVYCGVFDENTGYAPGDVITYKGSIWMAEKDVQGVSPKEDNVSTDWRLIVKAGRDGRTGKDGADGVQFQAGYVGEYEEDKVYSKNSIVTYASSTWLSKRPTKDRPPYLTNTDNEHWLRLR